MTTETELTFDGFAAFEPGIVVKPWSYHPRLLGDNDVEINILYSSICYSDIHTMRGDWGKTEYPCIVGHEICGLVVKIGKLVTEHKINDRVAVGPQVLSCHDCNLCSVNEEQYCSKRVFAYNDKYPDGQPTYGGYSKKIRINENHVVKVPDNLELKYAVSMTCAANTVFSPLKYYGAKEGMKLAIVGLGGLGHFAVMFANAMGCDVTVVSHSEDKKDLALNLGAKEFLLGTDENLKTNEYTFDMILSTTYNKNMNMELYLNLLKPSCKFIILGLQENKMTIPLHTIITHRIQVCGSVIGSAQDLKETFELADKHQIKPLLEYFPMTTNDINRALKRMVEGKVRFRAVLFNMDYVKTKFEPFSEIEP